MSEIDKYKQCLDEIEEILLKTSTDSQVKCISAKSRILNKIKEIKLRKDSNYVLTKNK